MTFFHNPEIRRFCWLLLALSVLLTVCGFLFSAETGWFTLCVTLLLSAVFLCVTYRRYRRIRRLSQEIDRLLYSDEMPDLASFSEGELSLLQSELYKMTMRLRQQADELLREKRYLTDSIADISHQLRTPLTSMNLMLPTLLREELPRGRRVETLREMERLLSRIDWLIVALLKMSRIDANCVVFQHERVRLQDLAERAVAPLQIPLELRGISVRFAGEPDAVFWGDAAWTVEALGNVCKNCMEHTPEGGVITLSYRKNAIYSEVVVQDTGPGIEPEDLPHLFERFYRGKHSSDAGVGIGLALARTIVTAQNGSIRADNAPDGGARFTIRFYKGTV